MSDTCATGSLENIDQIRAQAPALHALGVCATCILRSAQVPLGPAYFGTTDSIHQALHLPPPSPPPPSPPSLSTPVPCPICLDTLSAAIHSQITTAYTAECFDSPTLCITVEFPKSIYIRQRSLAIHTGRAPVDIKDTVKYVLGHRFYQQTDNRVRIENETGEVRVEVGFKHEETAMEHQFLVDREGSGIKTKTFRKKGVYHTTGDSKTAILDELDNCDDAVIREKFASPPPAIKLPVELDFLNFKRPSLFIGGRYLKLKRNISQTPFVIDGRRVTELSVSEVIGEPIQKLVRCDAYNLVGSGREDADVRMLGDGRPFYLECINPRIKSIAPEAVSEIENQLRKTQCPVQVRRLQVIQAADTSIIKEGEEHKTKHYCALVWFARPLDETTLCEINRLGEAPLVLQQKTPLRVLHRRAPLTREKTLVALQVAHIEGHFYRVRIESEAGTYIKEF
ncbi:hypothetical protein LPJ66_009872, partial [Kickxella alabastrina]